MLHTSFIVDYIVKSALGPILDKCTSISDLKKIKVLDPTCGSGSFLVRAVELINNKYKEFGAKGDEMTKIQILRENIYGVDLDEQAVEIARLNLLITALDSRMKLPPLTDNIKNGNSLISGTDSELKKYFGKNLSLSSLSFGEKYKRKRATETISGVYFDAFSLIREGTLVQLENDNKHLKSLDYVAGIVTNRLKLYGLGRTLFGSLQLDSLDMENPEFKKVFQILWQ